MGVLYDYFRAPDTATAVAMLARAPLVGPDAAMLDAVDGGGVEPTVMLVTLQSLLTGTPYDELPSDELLAMKGEDGPWIMRLSAELRDALAGAEESRLPAVAQQWVRTEEFGDTASAADALVWLGEIIALARRARQAGERLYCWICL